MADLTTLLSKFLTDMYGWASGAKALSAVSARSTAQIAAVSSVVAVTVGASDGTYDVCANVLVTTATNHSFAVECAYTDEGNTARTITFNLFLVNGSAVLAVANANGTVPYHGVSLQIRCKASSTITIRTQAAGTYTTVVYNVEGTIRQIA